MSSRLAGVKPFSANTSSAASSRSERVRSRRRSLVHSSTMVEIVPQNLRSPLDTQILSGIFGRDERGDVMSDLSSKKPAVTESLSSAALGAGAAPASSRVKIWAVAGALLLLLQLYVWIRWITGPYFERVPAGPSDPP